MGFHLKEGYCYAPVERLQEKELINDKQTRGYQVVAVKDLRQDAVVDAGQAELHGKGQTHSSEAERNSRLPEPA